MQSLRTEVQDFQVHALMWTRPEAVGRLPVALVHGLSVSSRYMIPLAQRLQSFYPVYAPDLPGFGLSERPEETLTIPELAAVLDAWLVEKGLPRVALVGNSLGCQVIARLAATVPERVAGAVLIAPTMDPDAPSALAQIVRGAQDIIDEPLSYWKYLFEEYISVGLDRTLQSLQYGLDDDMQQVLPEVRAPTLVMRGELDTIVPQAWAERVTRLLPRGRLVEIAGESHVVHVSAPDEVARQIRAFLSEVEGEQA